MPPLIDNGHTPVFLAWFVALVVTTFPVYGQDDDVTPPPNNTFGFFLGPLLCYAVPEVPEVNDLPSSSANSIPAFLDSPQAGFSMGLLWERKLTGNVSVRALPALHFLNGNLEYEYPDGRAGEVAVERTEAALSVQLMLGGKLPGGARVYMGLGPMIGCGLVADPTIQRIAWRADLGCGIEFRVARFRMAVEVCGAWQPRALYAEPEAATPLNVVDGLHWNAHSLRLVLKG